MFRKKISAKTQISQLQLKSNCSSQWIEEQQLTTIIAKNTVLTGNINIIEGDIYIWGKVNGNIKVKNGIIRVMNGGRVDGELFSSEIIIDGKVKGVCCANTLDILEHGELHGTSRCAGMTIQRGGQFIGQSESGESLSAQNDLKDLLSNYSCTKSELRDINSNNNAIDHKCLDPENNSKT